MVFFPIAALVSAAALSSSALGAPVVRRDDSAIGEPGVRSPNGTPVTDNAASPTGVANYAGSSSASSAAYGGTSTMMSDSPMSSSSSGSYSMPMYGSGSSSWNSGYQDCVQQCMNTYGAPPATYTAPSYPMQTQNSQDSSSGGGQTWDVIVAPAQGVLRFVPFALNASVGDTVRFQWGGSPHTVTKSSILEPCNKSSDPDFFTSGVRNKSATFEIKINDTNPIWYYCGVPGHCPKGMFGVINPPNAAGAAGSMANMAPALMMNNTNLATEMMYTNNQTMGTSAYTWGDNLDMSKVPASMQSMFAENVMMTRLVLAANPTMLVDNKGTIMPAGGNITVPADITQLALDGATPANAQNGTSTDSSSSAPSGTSSGSSASASATGAKKNGALSRAAGSSVAIGGVAILASMLLL